MTTRTDRAQCSPWLGPPGELDSHSAQLCETRIIRSCEKMTEAFVIRGGSVLDVATGESRREDVGVADGLIVDPSRLNDSTPIDAGGLTISFGLWDVHCHPGSLMYDRTARGYFEGAAGGAVRASRQSAAGGLDGNHRDPRSWARPDGDRRGPRPGPSGAARLPGPRLSCARAADCAPRADTAPPIRGRHVGVRADLVCDGPDEMFRRAIRGAS